MTVLKQAGIILLGLVLAGAMAVLGVWQLDVYRSQGADNAQQRAAAPPLELRDVAPPGAAVREGFGRTVRFTGVYDPELQLLIPLDRQDDTYRLLSGLRQADDSIVPVVRGVVTGRSLPPAPTGEVAQEGVLLQSEDDAAAAPSGASDLDAVRLPVLAQRWPGQLIGGYISLSAAGAQAQGLTPVPVQLPEAKGRLRNAAYAFQWWLFGAFAVALSIRMARDLSDREQSESQEEDGLIPTDPA